jgi:hypothetical protein
MLSIPDYPNYEIDIDGNVRNSKTQRVLKPWLVGPYMCIRVINENGHKKEYVHRLMGFTWLPQPTEPELVIDHIDRNKLNNHASNLRWVTHSENAINKEYKPRDSNMHHITKGHKGCGFIVQIQHNMNREQTYFPTLEQAVEFRDANL